MATTATTVAVGIDIGSYNARVATFDQNLNQPVCAHNKDGHRTTQVVLDNELVTAENLDQFLEASLIPLASDAAHTKNLHIVTSIPNNDSGAATNARTVQWTKVLQKRGGVITEATAVCLAYSLEETAQLNQTFLVVDGGATGVKVSLMRFVLPGIWLVEFTKTLSSVNGTSLVEPLAQSVAQQFETKHRFPRGEVWQSKKARAKLQKACEAGLTTLQINNTLTIHVDGLYEGMDCQVAISKAKWDHLSNKLVNDSREFLKDLPADRIEYVLLSGNLHTWMKPIVQSVFPGKLLSTSIDPAEAIALGCTKQARWNINDPSSTSASSTLAASMTVPSSPISIAINQHQVVIEKGTPLPTMVQYECSETTLQIWQMEPKQKHLASIDDLSANCTIRLLLSEAGKLQISVGGDSFMI